ncbi:potassium-transporting ATPase subunit F [Rummeliibacillus suwonensis]
MLLAITILVIVYLIHALLNPEKY